MTGASEKARLSTSLAAWADHFEGLTKRPKLDAENKANLVSLLRSSSAALSEPRAETQESEGEGEAFDITHD